MKKYISTTLLCILTAICLCGCGGSTKLAESFDENTVKETAQKAVDCLIAGEYDDCVAMMGQEMQEALPAEALEANVAPVIEQAGVFREYKSITALGQKGSDGADCGVAVVVADFEKGDFTYTISFNAEMEIIGLWMK